MHHVPSGPLAFVPLWSEKAEQNGEVGVLEQEVNHPGWTSTTLKWIFAPVLM